MNEWILRDESTGNERHFDTKAAAQEAKTDMESIADGPLVVENVNADGGTEAEVIEADASDAEPVEASETAAQKLRENADKAKVSDDPLSWIPHEFQDTIDGSVAINRKGFLVLANHYGISVESTVQVGPAETDFEYCQCVAKATTQDGITYQAHGSAHVDRGDDSYLLLEMADTRAQKRVLAAATGVGMVAVEELKNEL